MISRHMLHYEFNIRYTNHITNKDLTIIRAQLAEIDSDIVNDTVSPAIYLWSVHTKYASRMSCYKNIAASVSVIWG